MCPIANHFAETLLDSKEDAREIREDNSVQENDTCINVSSD
jgi:hypothetical protein